MPTATLPSVAPARHSAHAAVADAALECPSCASTMTVTANPYFGTGLAEHRNIALCNGCLNIAFIPEPELPEVSLAERVAGRVLSLLRRR